jgi:hypothetical protein
MQANTQARANGIAGAGGRPGERARVGARGALPALAISDPESGPGDGFIGKSEVLFKDIMILFKSVSHLYIGRGSPVKLEIP